MSFPISPSNGLITVVNGTTYIYSSTYSTWTRVPANGNIAVNIDNFTGDGTTTSFTMSSAPADANNVIINVNGVIQLKSAYTITANSTTLTLSSAPANGAKVDAIIFKSGGTSATSFSSAVTLPDSSQFITANSFGMHNRLINGAMEIDQRNIAASQTITAGAAIDYTVDRWYAYSTGANVTGQRVAGAGALQYVYQFTGAASTTGIGFGQRIETSNCYDLNNSTITLSAFLSNSLLSTVTWTAYYANSTDTFGTLASPTRTQIATGSWTVTSSLARYSANIILPGAATTGIEIVFTVGAQTSGTWKIGAVQFEPGSVMTPFERRLYGTEANLCYRYCYGFNGFSSGGNNSFFAAGLQNSTTAGLIGIPTVVPFRTVPTLTYTGLISRWYVYVTAGTYGTVSSMTINATTNPHFVLLQMAFSAAGSGGNPIFLASDNTQVARLILSAEL